jgi:hypothetical protein
MGQQMSPLATDERSENFMNKLLEFTVPGGTVVVESAEAGPGNVVRGSSIGKLTEKVGMSLDDTLSVVHPIADATFAALRELAPAPASVEIEFGLNFNGSIGAFIAQAKAEASLHIKLVWKPA